jgi:hypothetical protein
LNLPDYLAPAPEFNEDAHGFDFPFRAYSPSWADPRQEFTAQCKCGETIRIPQPEVRSALHSFSPFRDRVERHAEEVRARDRLAAKWGGLDNVPAAG